MTAKEYLKQVRTLDMEIDEKAEELYRLKQKALCVSSVVISERVLSSNENSSNAIIDKIVDMQNEINDEIDKLVDLKSEIRSKINQIAIAKYRILLTKYFINCKTLEKSAEEMNYSRANTFKIYSKAIRHFAKKFNFD